MTEEQRPAQDAELGPEDEERLEELVAEQADESAEEISEQLDLDNLDDEPGLADRIAKGLITETDMVSKARTELYKKMNELGVRDLLAVYVRGLALEEARLRTNLRKKSNDLGIKDLREKAKKAGAGRD